MTPRMHAAYISFAAGVVENVWRQPATLLRIITITARQRGKRVAADGDVLELPRDKPFKARATPGDESGYPTSGESRGKSTHP